MKKHGFELVREEFVKETGGIVRLWRHEKTGAELLSVCNKDENKCFGAAFRTPPSDSTGVAHIMEHSVLCGSDKYPVKEPFAELLKGSLQTFLNALTFPDKTCYPVASCNLRDFYNLVDVYLDAVFHPRIDRSVFAQEGWHVEAEDESGPWEYSGVVYNEMKGAYSSVDSVLQEQCQHAIFPDTLYSLDSGGDPAKITELTFEQFRAFHEAYYHPSNTRFFFWGDDPEDARLARLEEVLVPYERREPSPMIPLQPRWSAPRRVKASYAGSASEKAHFVENWLLCETKDAEELCVLTALDQILSGLPGSPLRKALMDSGLGEEITGCGLETDLRQSYFSIGLRSIDAADADKVETLILDTLKKLAEGVSADDVKATLSSLEFTLRENNTGSFPRGLVAMFGSLSDWLYDGDPFTPLKWEKPLASLKARIASGEPVFENAIRHWLLENPHRVSVLLEPDTGLDEKRNAEEAARMEALRGKMDERARLKTVEAARALHEAQRKQDGPEALATIPQLGVADLPVGNAIIPSSVAERGNMDWVTHNLDTSGILYACLSLKLSSVPQRLLPLLTLYGRALMEMGTQRRNYVDLGLAVSIQTGGMGVSAVTLPISQGGAAEWLFISGKCVAEKVGGMASLMEEILLEPNFDNRERFLQIAVQEKARMEMSLVPAGHRLVAGRVSAHFSKEARLAEEISGVSSLFFLRELCRRAEEDWPSVLADLQELHRCIVNKNGAKWNLTADEDLLRSASSVLAAFSDKLPAFPASTEARIFAPLPKGELLSVPSQVNYVGLGACLSDIEGWHYDGSMAVIMRHLSMGYLWDRIRILGGAYGCFGRCGRLTGALSFASYRDPQIGKTLEVYRGIPEYLGNLALSKTEVEKAIVGAIGDMDSYMLPGAKGSTSFMRLLSNDTEEMRLRLREEIMSTDLADFHDAAPFFAKALDSALPCILGGSDAEAFAKERGWTVTPLLENTENAG